MKLQKILSAALAVPLSLLALPAMAAGTLAGTDVVNTATVSYDLGAGAQTATGTATFEVDRQIDLTVDEADNDYRKVVNADTDEYLTFTVTNTGNSPQDFRLLVTTAGLADPHGGTDTYNETVDATAYVDNGDGVFVRADDTATHIENLGPDLSATVFIVAPTVTGDASVPDISAHALTAYAAQVLDANGNYVPTAGLDPDATETNVGVVDDPTYVDTVFVDDPADGTGARDGADSDIDAFLVVNAVLTVTKTATVLSDPINGNLDVGLGIYPKAIPGAIVRYVITVENNTPDTANSVSFSDPVPAQTLFRPGSLFMDPDGTGLVPQDEATADGTGVTNFGTLGSEIVITDFDDATLPSGETATIQFNVTIQ